MYKNLYKQVINLMRTKRMKQILENRRRLKPIIEVIIFPCQHILLREVVTYILFELREYT